MLVYRAEYNPDQYLWERDFTLAGRTYIRQDLEASMEMSYHLPGHCRLLSGNVKLHYGSWACYIIFWKYLQLTNARGHTLHCSHYLPSPFPEDASLPCVIYCHGNRYVTTIVGFFFFWGWFCKFFLLFWSTCTCGYESWFFNIIRYFHFSSIVLHFCFKEI